MPLPAAPLLPRLPASRRLAFAAKLVGALLIAVATGWQAAGHILGAAQ